MQDLDLEDLLRQSVARGASDIHLKAGNVPHVRIQGRLQPLGSFKALHPDDTENLSKQILNEPQQRRLAEESEVDLAFGLTNLGRFRLSVFSQRNSISLAIRVLPSEIRDFQELNLPEALRDIADSPRGLVLVTGVTGSGKSTTLAAMIRHINEGQKSHIITIEDPIEFLFEDRNSLITQREVSIDTADFVTALRAALRQDPDVIMVGEMRDVETFRIALQAAQTGHLVLSTLHTIDAVNTVDRVIAMFPPAQQSNIRFQFAAALNSIVSMRLVRSSLSGELLPAVEILRNTEMVHSLVSDSGRTRELRKVMETSGPQYGMQTFDRSLLEHFRRQMLSREDAIRYATSPDDLSLRIQGIVAPTDSI